MTAAVDQETFALLVEDVICPANLPVENSNLPVFGQNMDRSLLFKDVDSQPVYLDKDGQVFESAL